MKIMVWNIEKFTDKKFQDYKPKQKGTLGKRRRLTPLDTTWRLDYMRGIFNSNNNAGLIPDIIAVVETMVDDYSGLGQPMSIFSADGVLQLLNLIKLTTNNQNWRVVPPIKCNPPKPIFHAGKWAAQEAVATFYNTDTVLFEGPDYWNGHAIQRAPINPAQAYHAPWDDPNVTGGTGRAGRIAHTDANGAQVLFPADMNRRPFMVDFREAGGARRLFRCLFVHTSPQRGPTGTHITGTTAIARIADMDPANNQTGAPDVYVACGDFNVNDYYAHERIVAYPALSRLNYKIILRTTNTDSTHYRRKDDATPQAAPFSYQHREIIDNFFVLHEPGPQPSIAGYRRTSIDSVEGLPPPWVTAMHQDLATINAIVPAYRVPGPTATFHQWENFWCIIATSDHLPIYVRIP